MADQDQKQDQKQAQKREYKKSPFFTEDGKPVKVLSTSLGIALLANSVLITGAAAAAGTTGADGPKLVEWSSDEVKAYYDEKVDWNIPLPEDLGTEGSGQGEEEEEEGSGSSGTTIINNMYGYGYSGFGWDDLLLYHFLFNSGSFYSSSRYYDGRRGYYAGSTRPYSPRSYSSGAFQSRPVAGSSVRPRTSDTTGSVTRRSTSSKSGSIGGSTSSGSSRSSGGFGG